MPLKEHADFTMEQQRLEETITYIKKAIKENIEYTDFLRKDTIEAFKELDYRDSNLIYDHTALNTFIYEHENIRFVGLLKAQHKPYFSRIDVKLPDSEELKKLYIGKMALAGDDMNNPLIVDWRAPVASVYYNGRLGDVSYDSPDGEQKIKLYLKRQYTINNGELENILDVDITTNDAFLQAALGENKDNRLQDIVSTIQAEQNEIIRADIHSPIIVQGVAGSGKTTIALHRIAYLIYTFEKDFHPSDFLIIAPNKLFLNYISEVLPELGVERVKQTTFIDIAFEILGSRYKMSDPEEKITRLIGKETEKEKDSLRRVSEYKSSLEYRDMIDNYISSIEKAFIPDEDFCLEGHVIVSSGAIKQIFQTQLAHLPLFKRIPLIRSALSKKLRIDSKNIINDLEESYDQQIQHVRYTNSPSPERKEKIVSLMDEKEEKIESLKKSTKTAVAKYLALLPKKKDITHYHNELITNQDNVVSFSDPNLDEDFIDYFCRYNTELLRKRKIEFEDLTAFLYLNYKLFEKESIMDCKYIVIDEAQDFSLFQLNTLKVIFNTQLFTLLGDLAQGIHSYRGIKKWQDVIDKVLPSKNSRYLTLSQSYRTTIEIMNAANEVIRMCKTLDLVPAKPVVRNGEKPCISRFCKKETLLKTLDEKIESLQAKQYKTIAIICKTVTESSKVKALLEKSGKTSVKQLSSEDTSYEGGVLVVPSYLAKGLEFDAVIICSIAEDYSLDELDIKLLYVCMTRALHHLEFLCMDNNMKILNLLSNELLLLR